MKPFENTEQVVGQKKYKKALSVWTFPGLWGKKELLLLSFNTILELSALQFHRKHHRTSMVQ